MDEQMGIKIIIWGAWYGSKNVGDQALLLSISDLLGEAMEDVEFIVITADPDHVQEYTQRDTLHRFRALYARKQFFEIVKAFGDADLFIFGGGVPFYDDLAHSAAIVLLAALSRIFKVPCVLWAVSSQKIRSTITRLALRYLLSYSFVLTCRDRHTYNLLSECGAKPPMLQVVADPVFTLHSSNTENALRILEQAGWNSRHTRPLVALTPRLLRSTDGEAHTHYTPKAISDGLKEIDVFAAVLDWLWEKGYQPIFIPMHTILPDDDRAAARRIMDKAKFGKNALLIDEEIFPRDAANIYAHCQAGFVARVHGSVTAFLSRCPVMMYAFDRKHVGIMEQMGLPEYIFDPDIATSDDAVRMMGRLLKDRFGLAGRMAVKHDDLVKQARLPCKAVLGLLKQK